MEMIENRCPRQTAKIFQDMKSVLSAEEVVFPKADPLPAAVPAGALPAAIPGGIGRRRNLLQEMSTEELQTLFPPSGKIKVCTAAAGLVDQYCMADPNDKGATAVQAWLQALGCAQ
eukprot:CAMPEP_0196580800 /NCGR_PEP_ID=MMETSP1081-20130531/30651_1 /TAXON_ID=36882 /ORGANISM="Pyramimonas amylifera, Strain CCMP720" /LENGTH=115 /DNA_ID=CAMNT_0041900785 /DNA_START=151 /DNA_END=498 /DNA_ORIENTATION=+